MNTNKSLCFNLTHADDVCAYGPLSARLGAKTKPFYECVASFIFHIIITQDDFGEIFSLKLIV